MILEFTLVYICKSPSNDFQSFFKSLGTLVNEEKETGTILISFVPKNPYF